MQEKNDRSARFGTGPQSAFSGLPSLSRQNRRVFSRIGFALTAYLLAGSAVSVLITLLLTSLFPGIFSEGSIVWLSAVSGNHLIGPLVFFIMVRSLPDAPRPERVKLSPFQIMTLFILSYGILYVFELLSSLLTMGIGALKGSPVSDPLGFVTDASPWLSLLCGAVLAPIVEEAVFRGLILNKLRRFGEGICIFASGIFFALFHCNLSQGIYAFALGAFFAFVTLKTGTIFYSVLMHIGINFFGAVLTPALLSLENPLLSAAGSLFLLGLALSGIVLFFIFRRRFLISRGAMPLTEKEKAGQLFFNPGVLVYIALTLSLLLLALFL